MTPETETRLLDVVRAARSTLICIDNRDRREVIERQAETLRTALANLDKLP